MNPRYGFASLSSGVLLTVGLVLFFVSVSPAQVHFGLTGGYAGSATAEGLAGFSKTEFGGTGTIGAGAGYRFRNGAVVGVRAERLKLELEEAGASMGKLDMRPVLVSFGYQSMPAKGRGFAGHVQVGGGMSFTGYDKGAAVRELERMYRAEVQVHTKNAPTFEVGGGVDYFLSPKVSLTTDFRFLGANVATSWSAAGNGRTVAIPEFEKFFASTGQVLAGVRLWLK